MDWFVTPDTRTLTLPSGAKLIVRQELTCGEERQAIARMSYTDVAGNRRLDPLLLGRETAIAYLLDWTVTDASGAVVPIRGLAPADLADVLDGLKRPRFAEIKAAIDAHDAEGLASLQEKKDPIPATANGSGVTSISVS